MVLPFQTVGMFIDRSKSAIFAEIQFSGINISCVILEPNIVLNSSLSDEVKVHVFIVIALEVSR